MIENQIRIGSFKFMDWLFSWGQNYRQRLRIASQHHTILAFSPNFSQPLQTGQRLFSVCRLLRLGIVIQVADLGGVRSRLKCITQGGPAPTKRIGEEE